MKDVDKEARRIIDRNLKLPKAKQLISQQRSENMILGLIFSMMFGAFFVGVMVVWLGRQGLPGLAAALLVIALIFPMKLWFQRYIDENYEIIKNRTYDS